MHVFPFTVDAFLSHIFSCHVTKISHDHHWQHFRKFESLKTVITYNGGGALIDLVCRYPRLWDDPQYKDQNNKDAKLIEIATILEIPGKYAFMITCIHLLMIFLQALL